MAAPGADKVRQCPQQRAGPSPVIAAEASISSVTRGPVLPASPTPMVSRMKMRAARTAASGKSLNCVRLTCSARTRIASLIPPPHGLAWGCSASVPRRSRPSPSCSLIELITANDVAGLRAELAKFTAPAASVHKCRRTIKRNAASAVHPSSLRATYVESAGRADQRARLAPLRPCLEVCLGAELPSDREVALSLTIGSCTQVDFILPSFPGCE